MPKLLSPAPVYRIEECPDLMADALICDEQCNLILASIWGHDTAVQEFLARLTLGPSENGLESFHLETDENLVNTIFIGNVDALDKRTGRTYERTLFGPMLHLWLFDKRCVKPDKANSSALSLLPKEASNRMEKQWKLVQETCPLPLLDHWRDTVLEILQATGMLSPLPVAIGILEGHRLALDIPVLTDLLSELIRNGTLGTSPSEIVAATPLLRVA